MTPFDPYNLPDVDAIMRRAKFPSGGLMPPVNYGSMAPVKQPGFFDRLQSRVMPTPEGMQQAGLLTDDDIKHARRQGLLGLGASLLADSGPKLAQDYVGPMQALGRGIQNMQGAYQGAMASSMGMRDAAQQHQAAQQKIDTTQLALDQAKALKARRHEIIANHPVPTDPTKMAEWIDTVLPQFIDADDDETTDSLIKLRDQFKTNVNRFQQTQTGDSATTFDPATGKFWDPSANGGKGGWATSVQRRMNPDELLAKQQDRQLRSLAIQGQADANKQRQYQTLTSGFLSRNKDVTDRATILKQALTTLRDSQHDPALYTSSVANFIQAADQKAQIRWQLLKYFKENVDPSIGGRWETLKARMLEGKLPGYVSDSMIKHLTKLLAMSTEEYNTRRAGEVKRHPDLEGWIPPADEYFSEGSFGPGGGYNERPSLDDLYKGAQ